MNNMYEKKGKCDCLSKSYGWEEIFKRTENREKCISS